MARKKKYAAGYRTRIIISMLLFFVAIFVPLVLYGITTDRRLLQEQLEQNGTYLVKNLAINSELGVFSENPEYLQTPLEAITQQPDVLCAAVYNLSGSLIAERVKQAKTCPPLPNAISQLMHSWPASSVRIHAEGVAAVHFFAPVYLKHEPLDRIAEPAGADEQIGIARVGMSRAGLAARTRDIMLTAAVLAAVFIVMGLCAILFITRSIARPVTKLSEGAHKIGGGELGTRIAVDTRDELGDLARSFNSMADQLQQQMEKRRQIEEEMQRLMSAVEQAAETVMIIGPGGEVLYANPAVGRITGYSPQEVLGRNFGGITSDPRQHDEVWRIITTGRIWSGQVNAVHKNGAIRNLEITISPVYSQAGSITGFVSIGRDITGELHLEEQLRHSQKMEAIGTLAGGIAHDFNNILAAIMGYTELSIYAEEADSPLQYNLDQILRASHRARDLVKQILAFSRKDLEGRKPLQAGPVVKESIKLLRASIPATVDIRTTIEDAGAMIQSTPTHINQLLMNLCTNAAQAMSDSGGVLHISLSRVLLDEVDAAAYADLEPGGYLKLSVSDTGAGMDPGILGRIFEPFFTTKDVGKGTGMGLAVVHGIVKSHDGAVKVYSEPGAGSTFVVLLPSLESGPGEMPAGDEALPTGTERILFVDDEQLIVQVARQMILSLGYAVEAYDSSLEALAAFSRSPAAFDLVITDQTMPNMTGHVLIGRLTAIRPDIPVILSTGYSEKVSQDNARKLGFSAYIMKPLSRRELAATIRRVLDDR